MFIARKLVHGLESLFLWLAIYHPITWSVDEDPPPPPKSMYRMQYDTVAFWAGLVSFSCRSYNYRSICGHATGTLGTDAETWSGTASYSYRSI